MFKATITKFLLVLLSILSFSNGNVPLGMLALLGIPVAIIYFGVNNANTNDYYRGAKRNEKGFFTDNRGKVNPSLPAYKPKYTLDSEREEVAKTAAGIGLVTAATTLAYDDHADRNASFFDDDASVNPATGLPMLGGVDSAGNPFGSAGLIESGLSDDLTLNPATGLPMSGGFDAAGNSYGHDNASEEFSHGTFDDAGSIDSFDTTDTFSSFDSSDSFNSFDDNW